MSFNIRLTDGALLTTVDDGTINDTSCSLTLIGKNYVGYGTLYNENIVHLLENFSNDTAPNNPITGQLWWDTAGNLNVYNGSIFKTIATINNSLTAPTDAVTGNTWWNTQNQQFYVYNGSEWVLIGPAFQADTGTSGLVVQTIIDTNSNSHVVVYLYVGSSLLGVYSKDDEFAPLDPITGFVTIKPGFNLISESVVANVKVWGVSYDADNLGGYAASTYLRDGGSGNVSWYGNITASNITSNGTVTSTNVVVSGNLTTGNLSLLGNITSNVNIDKNLVVAGNATINGNLTVSGNILANISGIIRPTSGTGEAGIMWPSDPGGGGGDRAMLQYYAYSGEKTVLNISVRNDSVGSNRDHILLDASGGTNISNTLYVTSISAGSNSDSGTIDGDWTLTAGSTLQATYADLAEKFMSDQSYPPGTVVKIGGSKEITQENDILSENSLGIVSSNPAYIMNSALPDSLSVALIGKVPVRVIGQINKNDRLVSAGNGVARAAQHHEITAFNVLGRSLETKLNDNEELVLSVVKIIS